MRSHQFNRKSNALHKKYYVELLLMITCGTEMLLKLIAFELLLNRYIISRGMQIKRGMHPAKNSLDKSNNCAFIIVAKHFFWCKNLKITRILSQMLTSSSKKYFIMVH